MPRPVVFFTAQARPPGLGEAVEQLGVQVGRNANTVVGHGHKHVVGVLHQAHGNAAAFVGELDGV